MIRKFTHEEIQLSKPLPEEVKSFKRTPVSVVLNDIRSLYNVGAMFRTCDATLAEKMFLCGITGYPPRKEIDKVALGAVEVVPWQYLPSAKETLLKLKEKGVKIVALELAEGSVHFKEFDFPFPMALVVGNEVEGISDELMELVDYCVSIPMLGRANSLNVATAFGIVAYEILHQYNEKNANHN